MEKSVNSGQAFTHEENLWNRGSAAGNGGVVGRTDDNEYRQTGIASRMAMWPATSN